MTPYRLFISHRTHTRIINRCASSRDRKSTRLNSSHTVISYAVFCLKKKKHTSELQSHSDLVCRLLLEKNNTPPAVSIALMILRNAGTQQVSDCCIDQCLGVFATNTT